MKQLIFVSSVQRELAAERQAVARHVRSDPLLRRFFDVFLFEELPPRDRKADELYLGKVDRAAVFVGLYGDEYGSQDAAGLSPDVVREAIVNAVAHRDYASAAAIQVSVFSDRVEVWNPGALPAELTPESLRKPHASIARNARICEALFLTRYIEKYGTGTLMMIDQSLEAGLPAPVFEQRGAEFTVGLWRDWLTDEVLARSGLNERQRQAIAHVKQHGRITNGEYQTLTGCAERTALRDLIELIGKGVLEKVGDVGRGAHYVLAHGTRQKPAKPATPPPPGPNPPDTRQTRHGKSHEAGSRGGEATTPCSGEPGLPAREEREEEQDRQGQPEEEVIQDLRPYPQNVRIEHDKALNRVMTAVLKDDTELFDQFMDNESFRRFVTDTVFGLKYEKPAG